MEKEKILFTSESVTEGHPDKVCDQIADAILDEILKKDQKAKVACEVCVTTGLVLVMGEITTTEYVDVQNVVRDTVKGIGYDRGKIGFDAENLAVLVAINEQSPDIAQGVRDGEGAGDQGLMFGYATDENDAYMPTPIILAHQLTKKLTEVRKSGELDFLRPDGKSQVSVEYENNTVKRIDSIVISAQHNEAVTLEQLKKGIIDKVIKKVIPSDLLDENTKFYINPTGRFVIGGPKGDSGLTGRKIIVDTYGGYARHGGGSFSGKDPTKVDRSGSYLARYIAKNIVAAGLAKRIEIGLSYVIGMSEPTSIMVNTYQTSLLSDQEIIAIIRKHFLLTPLDIINQFQLRRPLYRQVSNYGHFGRTDLDLPWEKLDKIEMLKAYKK
ncbi:MAG: methionine adenosyltransferase [Bacilli bacterium]|jgi:S-adenosylmethionine synthetase|nr:methionine adenosyltransferase [Bacilli bacterium]MDY0063470.1 methionine adenosyltransferase [Bacilli bacterium]